jgi:hypothetical protein
VHATTHSAMLGMAGVTQAPILQRLGHAGAGGLELRVEQSYTGAIDPTGLVLPSFEVANVGHAGLDLRALYGWDVGGPPSEGAGAGACLSRTTLPVPACVGDAVARPL